MPDSRNDFFKEFFDEAPPAAGPQGQSDPWSDETWGQQAAMNVTFETVETDIFEFSAGNSVSHADSPDDVAFSLFRGGNAAAAAAASRDKKHQEQKHSGPPVVAVAVREQLSATYDDVSAEPSCHLEGTVHVRGMTDMSRHPFCLVMRDLLGHIEVLEDRAMVAKDVSQQISRTGLHRADRVLRISLPASATRKDVQVARYICSSRLRPVPLVRCISCTSVIVDLYAEIWAPHHFLFCVACKESCPIIGSAQSRGFQNTGQPYQSGSIKANCHYACHSPSCKRTIGETKSKRRTLG